MNLVTKITNIYCLLLLFLGSCNYFNSNPIKGAAELTKHIEEYAKQNEEVRAHRILSEYYNFYKGNDRKLFIRALRGELMKNDRVVTFLLEADSKTFPMFNKIFLSIIEVAIKDAMKNNDVSSPAYKGSLLGSILVDNYYNEEIKESSYLPLNITNMLQSHSELYKIIFFNSFKEFLRYREVPVEDLSPIIEQLEDNMDFTRMAIEYNIVFNTEND